MIDLTITIFKIKKYFLLVTLIFLFNSCQSQSEHDPELMTPDIDDAGMSHGYNYTPLGCLLAFPWEYKGELIDTSNSSDVYGVKTKIRNQQKKELVFELQKDGSLKYWFKSDYIVYPVDTVTQLDGIKTIRKLIKKSDSLKIKTIYKMGTWKVNFQDSLITIDFGKNNFGLNPLQGKIYLLSATEMCIVQDSTGEYGEKKEINTRLRSCFIH